MGRDAFLAVVKAIPKCAAETFEATVEGFGEERDSRVGWQGQVVDRVIIR
jgi:hypothetical protein